MHDLIIVYSKTGNTLSVAKRLQEVTNVSIEEVHATTDDPNTTLVTLTTIPDVRLHHHIVFGSPVHGFMPPKITQAYLQALPDLQGKTFDLFVTHYFPWAAFGGNQTLRAIKKIIEAKHGEVRHMISINWTSKKRAKTIEHLVNVLSQ